MIAAILLLLLQVLVLAPLSIILDVLGLIVVAVALPFAVNDYSKSDGRVILNLPKWAYIWGNDFDGALGDKRGWWAENTPFGVDVNSFFAKWWWLAIRNPANNMRMFSVFSAPVAGATCDYWGQSDVADKVGKTGVQLVRYRYTNGTWPRVGFYWVVQYGQSTKAFVVRFGYKVEPDYIETDEQPKGLVFKINPVKNL